MSVNWRLSAKIHRLPVCPECNAFESCPCTTSRAIPREPHRVRMRIAAGELFVITPDEARAAGLITRLRRYLKRAA